MVIWKQFDGIARPIQRSIACRLINLPTSLINLFTNDSAWLESNSSMIQEIVPAWKGLCVDRCKAEDALKDCLHVYHCAENYFLDLNGQHFTKEKVQKVIKINNNCMHLIIHSLMVLIRSVTDRV